MCFSATASFTSSAVIGAIGVFTLQRFGKDEQKYFATIPILFAVQQFMEGWVWFSFSHPDFIQYQHLFSICFLFFAWTIWPTLLPLSIYKLEKIAGRKRILFPLIGVGILFSMFSIYMFIVQKPFPIISDFHIRYEMIHDSRHPIWVWVQRMIYVAATMLPLLISSVKGMKWFAAINLGALLVAYYFYEHALPSTWCFFASILSGMLFWILKFNEDKNKTQQLS